MAKSNKSYSILVGVELDTSDIKKQLQDAAKGLKINLDTQSATNNLNSVSNAASRTSESIANVGRSASSSSGHINHLSQNARQAELSFQAANEIFQTSIELIGGMVEQVFTLDDALTEFKKVSDLSGSSLDNYVDELSEMGATVARTGSEMVEASTQFRKNGFNDEDAATLGLVATKFQNVSDQAITAADSASFIISQMVAFGIEAQNAEHIIDGVNEVSNNFSVSSADLANNLGNMSAVMSQTGNSFEQSLGMLTAVTEVTRNASKASRGK